MLTSKLITHNLAHYPSNANTSSKQDSVHSLDTFIELLQDNGFGEVHFKCDPVTGLQAIIAIHSTKFGPSLGGCRFISYGSREHGLLDAVRLAKGMTYKAAALNLPLGGGKAVIFKPNHEFDRNAYLQSFGRFVADLGGRYVTAVDSGTNMEDMDIIAQETQYVATSLTNQYEKDGTVEQHAIALQKSHMTDMHLVDNGDPSPYTAYGVIRAMLAATAFQWGKITLHDLTIAIQGLGNVGYCLARELFMRGAKLIVADKNYDVALQAKQEFGATVVAPEMIHTVDCDIFAPCALGAVLDIVTIPQLHAKVVAGAANNQLADENDAMLMHQRGILYAVDYIANGGGLAYAAAKYLQQPLSFAIEKINNIFDTLTDIFENAARKGIPTNAVAERFVQNKLSN